MKSFRRLTLAEQTAAHLREKLRSGHWGGKLPGVVRLCAEFQVSQTTMRGALRKLEAEGMLATGGPCRNRRIAEPGREGGNVRTLRVGILLHDARPKGQAKSTPLKPGPELLAIQNALEAAGHAVFFTRKSQVDLHHDVRRITRHIAETAADAWIVVAGSREVLEWFSAQPIPSFALHGRAGGLPMARTGPDKVPAVIDATRQLVALGHRRIVLITLSPRRRPVPGRVERAFLTEMAAHGIPTGDYNLPDWEETPEGFTALLVALFRHTPPTALIIAETARVIAAIQFFARHGIILPEHVSLVSSDYDESLAWCHPAVAHLEWSSVPIVRRVVRWVAALQRGGIDRETNLIPAEFVPGGSIGPARRD